MFATGMMDPNWWKYDALMHQWYRDDDAYADTRKFDNMSFAPLYIGVNFDGARGNSYVNIPMINGSMSFKPTDEPFEVPCPAGFELKAPDGTAKYRVEKYVCDKKALTFFMVKLSTNEEISVTMEIAPEGFTTDLFNDYAPWPNVKAETEVSAPAAPQAPVAAPVSPWVCPVCGSSNIGKYCPQCGQPHT